MAKLPEQVALATALEDLGLVPTATANKSYANEHGETVTLRDPVTNRCLATIKPASKKRIAKKKPTKVAKARTAPSIKAKRATAKPTKRATKTTKPTKPIRAPSAKGPTGKVAAILKLASKKNGARREELNTLVRAGGADHQGRRDPYHVTKLAR